MPRKKRIGTEPTPEPDAEVEEVEEEKTPSVSVVRVLKAGKAVRDYSLEQHGKKFTDLAEEFAKKIGGNVEKVK